MPSITTWEWNASPSIDPAQHLSTETPDSEASAPTAGAVESETQDAAGGTADDKEESSSGFAVHGLGAKVWRLRRRTIPIKPMTADERELYEQGKLGVEQFVIEEEEEEQDGEDGEDVPAPPSADLIHQAFADTMGAGKDAAPAQPSPPPQQRISPSKISALFAEMGTEDGAMFADDAPPHSKAPPSDAEKLDMMRIFAEAEGDSAGSGVGVSAQRREQDSGRVGEVDVSKLSDEELFRQLQLAQEQLVRGGVGSGISKGSGVSSGAVRGGMATGRVDDQRTSVASEGQGDGWQGDPALQAELQAAEEELARQERELQEARARALEEEELMRREELRMKAMAEQESKRKRILAEKEAASRKAAELENKRLQLEQQRKQFEAERKQAAELDVLKMQLESERQMFELEQQRTQMELARQAAQQATLQKQKEMELAMEHHKLQQQQQQQQAAAAAQREQEQAAAAAQAHLREQQRLHDVQQQQLQRQPPPPQQQQARLAPQMSPAGGHHSASDPVRQWLRGAETPAAAKGLIRGGGRANLDQPVPQSVPDVLLWLDDIGMGKYRQQFELNEIDGEMLLQLEDKDLGEIGVPAWSGDRQRISAAILHLKDPSAPPPPVNPAPSVAGSVAGGGRPYEKLPDTPVNEWLLSAGFGRFRTTFTQYHIFELHDLCQMERQDLLDLGIPDQGGQLGRLEASIAGLRYTLQASHAAMGLGRGAASRAMSAADDQSRWETETVSTTRSGKSKSSKRGKSKERKKIDFSLIEEAVKVSDIYGHAWDKRYAKLEANRLCLTKVCVCVCDCVCVCVCVCV